MSNLTVSYVSQTPAGTPAGVSAAAPAADGPLGFLAALVDQLLPGGAEVAATGNTAGAGNIDVAGLLGAALGAKAETTPDAPADPLAALAAQLDGLQGRIETGDAAGALPALRSAIDAVISAIDATLPAVATGASVTTNALASRSAAISSDQIDQLLAGLGLVDAPVPVAATAKAETHSDIAALGERLAALAQSLAATAPDLAQKLQTLAAKLEPIAADAALAAQLGLTAPRDPDATTIAHVIRSLLGHEASTDAEPAAGAAPQANDALLQVLATLGLNAPPATTTPSASAEPSAAVAPATAVPADLLRLSNQLGQVASELATAAPDLAKKLDAVATRLVSTDAGPELLAKLSGAASERSGTALDKLVQTLIEAKPVSTAAPVAPQVAAPGAMPLPAPMAPKQSKSAVTEVKAALPEPAPVTADSAPKPTPGVTLTAVAKDIAGDAEPKIEAKAAAIVADATRSDPAAQPAPQPQAPAAAQQARALPAAYQPVANPINMGQVAFEMVRQVHQGTSRFTIRLDPPEMGRVDVRMQVDANGTVNARLTVDRAETLDLFQRDRQSLERALSQAGLDAGKTNLEFSLRQNNHNPFAGMTGGDQRQQQPGYGNAPRFSTGSDDASSMPAITLYRGTASAGGVNIFA